MGEVLKFHTENTLSYVAGIIDGEGCIGINITHVNGRHGQIYDHMMLRVEVASTSRKLIDFLLNEFGGQFNAGKRPNRKPYYKWTVAALQGEKFLRLIYPYLLIKRDQAEIVFKFRATTKTPGQKLSVDEVAFRRKCYEELRNLKRAI